MISLDTETTGVDLYHEARPYLVTICDSVAPHDPLYWRWMVNPVSREVYYEEDDLLDIRKRIREADEIVLHNAKFDYTAMVTSGIISPDDWDWSKVRCTLVAGHVINSAKPHDLTSMVLEYCGVDIEELEADLQTIVSQARDWAEANKPTWTLAKKGVDGMPSAKASTWKYDTWLPLQIADLLNMPEDHLWRQVEREYALADSMTTLELWKRLSKILDTSGMRKIFDFRMTGYPIAHGMEQYAISISKSGAEKALTRLTDEKAKLDKICVNIAKNAYSYDLSLPKGASNNNSLLNFIYNEMKLPVLSRTPSGEPGLDKATLALYRDVLGEMTSQKAFIEALGDSRKRATAIQYLEGYRRYWLDYKEDRVRIDYIYEDNSSAIAFDSNQELSRRLDYWGLLHAVLNITGSSTLRWSSSNPNEQNVSKQDEVGLREVFGPAEGREWWSFDANNIELRIPSYESGEEELIAIFEEPTKPPFYGSNHFLIFSVIYPDIWDKVLREVGPDKVGPECKKRYKSTYYQWVKNGNFAVQYGAVDQKDGKGTADLAYHLPGAQRMISSRFTKQDRLNQYQIRYANQYGYVQTLPDSEVDPTRGYRLVCKRTDRGGVKPTTPLNYHVQGTAMWWTARAMYKVSNLLKEWNRNRSRYDSYYLIMQVHDELVFDFPKMGDPRVNKKASNYWRAKEIAKVMASCGDSLIPRIPTPVNIEYHPVSWSSAASYVLN